MKCNTCLGGGGGGEHTHTRLCRCACVRARACACMYVFVYVYNFICALAVQPGVARAFALRSTLLLHSCGSAQRCRFAPVASLNFVASLLWLHSASSIPDRSLNPQMTPLRSFVLHWTSVGFKKKPFSNCSDIHTPGNFLSWRQPALLYMFLQILSSQCGDVPLRVSVQPVPLFQPLSEPAASLC